MAADYLFLDEWDVDAPQEAVFDALAEHTHISDVVAADLRGGQSRRTARRRVRGEP